MLGCFEMRLAKNTRKKELLYKNYGPEKYLRKRIYRKRRCIEKELVAATLN